MGRDNTYTRDDLLTPLAIAVIIDNKVRDPELTAFITQAQGLLELFDLAPMEPDNVRDWFLAHSPELEEKLSGKRRNTTVLRALAKFENDLEVENIYDAMVAISVSDKEFVVEESDLMKSAGAIWGFPKPPIKVDRKYNEEE